MLKPRFSIGTRVMSLPSTRMRPPVASVMPRMMLSSVVLPPPEGPRIDMIRPSSSVRLTPLRTRVSPNVLVMLSSSSIFRRLPSVAPPDAAPLRVMPMASRPVFSCVTDDLLAVVPSSAPAWRPDSDLVESWGKGE